jgi:uncharacterized tellurite resistance protein B-like protein
MYTQEQKIAVMRVLTDIVLADGRMDEREQAYLNQLYLNFAIDDDALQRVGQFSSLLALTVIRDFSSEQKEWLAQLMGKMIIVDRDINYNEVRIYNAVNEFCHMNAEFREDDYPEYTHS